MSRQEQAQDGSPFGPSVEQATRGIWSADLFASLLGVLVSPGRGLLVYQPWLLLALAPLVPRLRRRPNVARSPEPRGWVACCVAVIALYLILVSAWSCWWGGHCWGSRLASEVVPLGALPCLRPLTALGSAPAGRRLVLAVALASALLHLPAVYLRADQWNPVIFADQDPARLWSWADAAFLFSPRPGPR